MKVAFYYHSGDYRWMMDVALASVRKHMPQAEVWHLHGPDVAPHPGVDKALGMEEYRRCLHHSLLTGETLFLDVDTVVQEDVSSVFGNKSFHIALAIRPKKDPNAWGNIPYNGGVVFSRSQDFWRGLDAQGGSNDGEVRLNNFLEKFGGLLTLDKRYNHAPTKPDEDLTGQAIVHWKGSKRKRWMRERYA